MRNSVRQAAASYLALWPDFPAQLAASVRHHAWLIGLVLASAVAAVVIGLWMGSARATMFFIYVPAYMEMMPTMVAGLVVARAAFIVFAERPKRPLSQLLRELCTDMATPDRIAHALPPLLLLPLFGSAFTLVKSTIPELQPYAWDATFEAWDRALHFGRAPWEWTSAVLGYGLIGRIIAWIYNSWFFALAFVMTWQAFSMRDIRLRAQYFLATLLVWVLLGSIAAVVFSSAGPCYFGLVTSLPDPYAPLMAHVANIEGATTRFSQQILWFNYQARHLGAGAGISAMPSIHVAMAALFCLLGWRTSRFAGALGTAFLVAILVGSVHLGWHYAIDGYVGALGAVAIWWLAGRMAPHASLEAEDGIARTQIEATADR